MTRIVHAASSSCSGMRCYADALRDLLPVMLRCNALLGLHPRFFWRVILTVIEAFLLLTRVEEANLVLGPTHYLGHVRADVVFEVPCNVSKPAIAIHVAELCLAVEEQSNVHASLYWSLSASGPHNKHICWYIAYCGPSGRLKVDCVAVGWVVCSESIDIGNEFVL
jgi:hypothetical protein